MFQHIIQCAAIQNSVRTCTRDAYRSYVIHNHDPNLIPSLHPLIRHSIGRTTFGTLNPPLNERLFQPRGNQLPAPRCLPQPIHLLINEIAQARKLIVRRRATLRRIVQTIALARGRGGFNFWCEGAAVQLAETHFTAICRWRGEGQVSHAIAQTSTPCSSGGYQERAMRMKKVDSGL